MLEEHIKRNMEIDFNSLARLWYARLRMKTPKDSSATITTDEWVLFQREVREGCLAKAMRALDKEDTWKEIFLRIKRKISKKFQ